MFLFFPSWFLFLFHFFGVGSRSSCVFPVYFIRVSLLFSLYSAHSLGVFFPCPLYPLSRFLCISLAPNFLNYIVINFLMASAWTTVFYFFSEAMMQSNIYTSVSILTLIALVTVITKKYINTLEAAKK